MIIYVTKYWHTRGIIECEAEICSSGLASVSQGPLSSHVFWTNSYEKSLLEAQERVKKAAQRKVASLTRQIKRVEQVVSEGTTVNTISARVA